MASADDEAVLFEELLLEAAKRGNEDLMEKTLAEDGVNVNFCDGLGNTAVHYAARGGHTKCLEMVLAAGAGASVSATNFAGETPVHKAAVGDDPDCMHLLLEAGAPAGAANSDGKTPLDLVKSTEVGALLLQAVGGTVDDADVASLGGEEEEEEED